MDLDLLNHAINLRKTKNFEESRQILFSLVNLGNSNGTVYLNIAWSYDNQGQEREALKYYKKTLDEVLTKEEKFEAIFGLACTYRCLEYLNEAEFLFIQLCKDYPNATEVIPFYALCLISLGKKDDALKLLFTLIIDYPPTEHILAYKTVISDYLQSMEL